MDIQASYAAGAYARARNATSPDEGGSPGLLTRSLQDFTSVLQQGEQTALAAMTGQADPHSLVQALSATEQAVEAVVVVRDRVVEAYQELLRMPV